MSDSAPVLYVEDEDNDVLFMKLAFDRAALSNPLQTVSDGQQAIDYLTGRNRYSDRASFPLPCLVLLDLNLPVKSGFDVLRWIRSQPEYNHLPVVVLTSSQQDTDVQLARESGANDYLVKPTSPTKLVEIVRQIQQRWLQH